MTDSQKDIWSQWLLHRRFGGDPEQMKKMFDVLYPVRDKVLSHVSLEKDETLLDVGCGDGLIAFGALEKFECQVIFSDISDDLLQHAESLAQKMNLQDRYRFVHASADDLSAFEDESIDAVTTRSVLIYVSAKQKALREFYRVLKPGGQLSIFEPINRFGFPEPPDRFGGIDVTPVMDIVQKLRDLYDRLQPPDTDPMTDFDERDLLTQVEKAGFEEIHLEYQAAIAPFENTNWFQLIRTAGNPKIPSLEEAMEQVLTPEEREKFIGYSRPRVESNKRSKRSAVAYLWAVK